MLDYINKLLCCKNNGNNERNNVNNGNNGNNGNNVNNKRNILHNCCMYDNKIKKRIISSTSKSKNYSNETVYIDEKFGHHSTINNIKEELENKMQFKNEKRRGVTPRIPV